MAVSSYLVVSVGNIVIDRVLWDGVTPCTPPAGAMLVPDDGTLQIGATYQAPAS